jgi:hypothetical protein
MGLSATHPQDISVEFGELRRGCVLDVREVQRYQVILFAIEGDPVAGLMGRDRSIENWAVCDLCREIL